MAEGVTQFADGLFSRSKALHFPCRDRQVVEIDADAELNTAFTVLVTHNLICAPVWDATQGGYIGWFDVDDALNIVADIDLISSATASDEAARLRTTAVKVVDVFNPANRMRNPELQPPWIAVGPMTEMKEVLRVLGNQARRVPVVDPQSGKVVKIISQMDVVRQVYSSLAANARSYPKAVFDATPAGTGVGMRPVVTVSEAKEARDAFRAMIDERVSAVGVVDEEDSSLIGVISNKDILSVLKAKGWGGTAAPASASSSSLPNVPMPHVPPPAATANKRPRGRFSIAASTMSNVDVFAMPAMAFVAEARGLHDKRKTQAAVAEIHGDATFHHIFGLLAATGFHRVFVVDDAKRPIGVVSASDLCKLLSDALESEGHVRPPPVPRRA